MKRAVVALAALLMFVTGRALAQTIPLTMNYQGRLAKPDGTPVPDTNTQQITFRLFANAAGGTALWQQTITSIAVHNGTFTTALDFSNGYANFSSFSSTFNTAPYLEIQVGTDAPLAPRQVFRSVAYAFTARTALTVPDGSIIGSKLAPGVLNFASLSGQILTSQLGAGVVNASSLNPAFGSTIGKFSGTDWLVSSTPTANGAVGITTATIGGTPYAFVTNYYANSFQIFNINSPAAPTLVSTIPTDTNPRYITLTTIAGTPYVFTANSGGNTVGIYNVANPATPILVKTLTTGAGPAALALGTNSGSTYLYVVNSNSSTLQLFNVTTPASATAAGSVATGGTPFSVAVSGTTAYVACYGGNSLQVVNAANPAAPVVSSTIANLPGATSIAISGPTLALACYSENTVRFYNIGGSPFLTGIVPTGVNPIYVVLSGTTAYVSCFGGGEVDVLDYTGRGRTVGIFPGQPQTNALAYNNGLLYITLPGNALNVINPANLTSNFAGALTLADSLNVTNTLNPDYQGRNRGTLAYGLRFGAPVSGEGIASNRVDATAGQNQNGLDFYTNYVRQVSITNGGRVGIGTANPAYPLDVSGDINASGSVRANGIALSSDARYKTNIATLNNALDDVLNLRGVAYDFDRAKWPEKHFADGKQIGFIAQEIEKIFPELVSTDANGYKSVNYIGVVPVLVEAVRTLKHDNDDKQKQIDTLRAQVEVLQTQAKENADIKKQIAELAAALKKIQDAQNK